MTRTFERMIDWAFLERGMHRAEIRASPANLRGWGIAVRLGMRREGLLRSAVTINGVQHDAEVWSMLADDWSSRAQVSRCGLATGVSPLAAWNGAHYGNKSD